MIKKKTEFFGGDDPFLRVCNAGKNRIFPWVIWAKPRRRDSGPSEVHQQQSWAFPVNQEQAGDH